jgi:hypothetical protein
MPSIRVLSIKSRTQQQTNALTGAMYGVYADVIFAVPFFTIGFIGH